MIDKQGYMCKEEHNWSCKPIKQKDESIKITNCD